MDYNKPEPLDLTGNVSDNFKQFKDQVNIYFIATKTLQKSNEVQLASLKSLLGSSGLSLYNSIRNESAVESVDYVMATLEKHCLPKQNMTMDIHNLFTRKQQSNEKFQHFYADLRDLIRPCKFEGQEEKILKSLIILGINNKELQERLLSEDAVFDKVLNSCKASELTEENINSKWNTDQQDCKVDLRKTMSCNDYEAKTQQESLNTCKADDSCADWDTKYFHNQFDPVMIASRAPQAFLTMNLTKEEHIVDVREELQENKENDGSEDLTGDPFSEEGSETMEGVEDISKEGKNKPEFDMVEEYKDDDSGSTKWDEPVVKIEEDNIVMADPWPEPVPEEDNCTQEGNSMEDNCTKEGNIMEDNCTQESNSMEDDCTQDDDSIENNLEEEKVPLEASANEGVLASRTPQSDSPAENRPIDSIGKHFICTFRDDLSLCQWNCKDKKTPNSVKKPYSCSQCSYRTTHNNKLARHIRTHTGEKPFNCSLCNFKTSHREGLTRHMRVHTGEKPFVCSHCGYKASHDLTKHMRMHTGEKPYSCRFCDYKSSHSDNLARHMKTHTGEKPFTCSHCDYKSSQRATLNRHMRVHTGEKPFTCTLCDYKVSYSYDLIKHMRIHTGEKPYQCSHCDYRSSHSDNLNRHLRTHTM